MTNNSSNLVSVWTSEWEISDTAISNWAGVTRSLTEDELETIYTDILRPNTLMERIKKNKLSRKELNNKCLQN